MIFANIILVNHHNGFYFQMRLFPISSVPFPFALSHQLSLNSPWLEESAEDQCSLDIFR